MIIEKGVADIRLDAIKIGDRHRAVRPDRIGAIAKSIDDIGLQTPIDVCLAEDGVRLVAGHHRLEACRRLEWEFVPVRFLDIDEDERELWELAENLHRVDLTKDERDRHIRRYAELLEKRREAGRDRMSHPGVDARGQSKSPQQLPGVARQIAEETGLSQRTVQRVLRDEPHVRGAFGTGETEWYTPAEYIEIVRDFLGEIDLDPATSTDAQATVKATDYFTAEHSGLDEPWRGRVWLNPPYAQPAIVQFIDKLIAEFEAGHTTEAVLLTHNYTDTEWFHRIASKASAICFTRGRIKFVRCDGHTGSPTQGQAFSYLGSRPHTFAEAFEDIGFVMSRMEAQP